MGLAHSPRIITDGLKLALDAGNSKSWNVGISADWTDRVGGHNGTLVNGTFHNDGPFVDAGYVEFDGTGDYVTSSASSNLDFGTGTFTIEGFFKKATTTGNQALVCSNKYYVNGNNGNWVLRITNASLIGFVTYDGIGNLEYVEFSASTSVDTWYHFALVREGTGTNETKFYLDGVLKGSMTVSKSLTDAGTNGLTIGDEHPTGPGNNPFNGKISNVRILKGTALYTSNFTVPTKSLTAITNTSLLTCQGNTITDASSSAHTITASGDITLTKEPFTGAGAVEFDGTGDYLSVPQSTDFQFSSSAIDFTIEAHVYGSAFSGAFTTIAAVWGAGGSEGQWLLSVNASGVLGFAWNPYSNSTNLISGGTLSTNTWYHVAVTRSGNTFRLFVDGAQTASGTNSGTNSNNTQLSIGRYAIGYSSYDSSEWEGYISNVRVIKGTALYTSAFTPPTRKLDPIENTTLLICQGQNIKKDASFSNHTISLNGNVKPTIVSSAFEFDGTDDYVTIPDSSDFSFGSGEFAIEAWFRPDSSAAVSASTYHTVFMCGAPVQLYWINTQFQFFASTSNSISYFISGSGFNSGSNSAVRGIWHHIVVTRTGNDFKMYLNGALVDSASTSSSFGDPNVDSVMGATNTSGIANFAHGKISNLKVYKGKGLTATEVTQNYNALKGRYV